MLIPSPQQSPEPRSGKRLISDIEAEQARIAELLPDTLYAPRRSTLSPAFFGNMIEALRAFGFARGVTSALASIGKHPAAAPQYDPLESIVAGRAISFEGLSYPFEVREFFPPRERLRPSPHTLSQLKEICTFLIHDFAREPIALLSSGLVAYNPATPPALKCKHEVNSLRDRLFANTEEGRKALQSFVLVQAGLIRCNLEAGGRIIGVYPPASPEGIGRGAEPPICVLVVSPPPTTGIVQMVQMLREYFIDPFRSGLISKAGMYAVRDIFNVGIPDAHRNWTTSFLGVQELCKKREPALPENFRTVVMRAILQSVFDAAAPVSISGRATAWGCVKTVGEADTPDFNSHPRFKPYVKSGARVVPGNIKKECGIPYYLLAWDLKDFAKLPARPD